VDLRRQTAAIAGKPVSTKPPVSASTESNAASQSNAESNESHAAESNKSQAESNKPGFDRTRAPLSHRASNFG
jgi:hypothetical protein